MFLPPVLLRVLSQYLSFDQERSGSETSFLFFSRKHPTFCFLPLTRIERADLLVFTSTLPAAFFSWFLQKSYRLSLAVAGAVFQEGGRILSSFSGSRSITMVQGALPFFLLNHQLEKGLALSSLSPQGQ